MDGVWSFRMLPKLISAALSWVVKIKFSDVFGGRIGFAEGETD